MEGQKYYYFLCSIRISTNYFKVLQNDKINDKINELDYEILKQLKNNKYMTIPEIASSLAKSEITIHRHMDNLVKNNAIIRVGSRKTGYWKILI